LMGEGVATKRRQLGWVGERKKKQFEGREANRGGKRINVKGTISSSVEIERDASSAKKEETTWGENTLKERKHTTGNWEKVGVTWSDGAAGEGQKNRHSWG